MKQSIRHYIGTIVLILWVLGVLDVIDFRLCVGPVGSCNQPRAVARTA